MKNITLSVDDDVLARVRRLTCNRIYPVLWESPRWVAPAILSPANRTGDEIASAPSPYRSTV